MNNRIKAHFSLIAASMIFGANYWIAKGLMPDYLSPEQIVLLRITGAFLLFYVFSIFTGNEKVLKKDLLRIAVAALFGISLNQLLCFKGLNLTTPVDMAIIHVSNPIFVLVFAAFMIKEKVTFIKITGILLGATGAVILILYRGEISFSSDTFTGNFLALLNTLAYAVYIVLIKPVMARYKPVTVMKLVFLFGFIFILPITLNSIFSVQWNKLDTENWLSLLYVVIATTFLAYLLTIYALKYVEASVASFYIYLQPVIATIIALGLGKQFFTITKALAALLIFGGVYLVSRRQKNSSEQVTERK